MVKIILFGEEQTIDQIPENYYDFIQIIAAFFSIEDIDKYVLEFTHDNKKFEILSPESYNNFFLETTKKTTVSVYFSVEETNTFKNKNNKKEEDKKSEEKKIEKVKEEEINTDSHQKDENDENNTDSHQKDENNENNNIKENGNNNDNDNDSNEIKIPPITREMVMQSIIRQQKEKIHQSRILLQKKEKEEKEKREKEEKEKKEREEKEKKGISDQINNLISDRLDNLKKELINESQIKFSQIVSESQINLDKEFENKGISVKKDKNKIIGSLEKHPNISCSKCGMNPIIGNRYCCVYCNNINYCEKCEEEIGFVHGHPLYKFKLRIE